MAFCSKLSRATSPLLHRYSPGAHLLNIPPHQLTVMAVYSKENAASMITKPIE